MHLDLIGKVEKDGSTLANYSYLSDGTKLSATDGNGKGLVYRGPFVYRKSSGGSSLTLESAAYSGGRVTAGRALLYVTDYLGSVRAVVDGSSGATYKVSDYSTFGEESQVVSLQTSPVPVGITLRDGYTGQENQNLNFGTSYIDFGARQYSPALRRWMMPDPLSEKYYGTSPYTFCNNNPVNFVDPDGEHPVVVGAVIGGAISGTAAIIKGKSFTEVIAATAGGAIDGAIAGSGALVFNKILKIGLGTIGGGVGDIVEQGLNVAFGNQDKIDLKSKAASAAVGTISSGASEFIESGLKSMTKSVTYSQSTYDAVEKDVKTKIKSTGRNPKPSEVKRSVESKVKAMDEATSTLVETSVKILDHTADFYTDIFIEDER